MGYFPERSVFDADDPGAVRWNGRVYKEDVAFNVIILRTTTTVMTTIPLDRFFGDIDVISLVSHAVPTCHDVCVTSFCPMTVG